ncbi:MAG: type III-B CRISPR-associated protein Cas10/Cmr2 [Candidatus Baldrarchaeia archaeon]
MGYWDSKISGILHDPLDKVLRIFDDTHAIDAKTIAKNVFNVNTSVILSDIENHHVHSNVREPDLKASAVNRIWIPKGSVERNLWMIHPLSGVNLSDIFKVPTSIKYLASKGIPPESSTLGKKCLDRVLEGSASVEDFNDIVWFLVPCYYEIYSEISRSFAQKLIFLPEDTRIPGSLQLSHLMVTSAFSYPNATPLKIYFVRLEIGGVQEFISIARTTHDLWSGSYLSSLIMFRVLREFIERFGIVQVIYPWLVWTPLCEVYVFKKIRDPHSLLYPTVPNSALIVIPPVKGEDVQKVSSIDPKELKKLVESALESMSNCLQSMLIRFLKSRCEIDQIPSDLRDQISKQLDLKRVFKPRVYVFGANMGMSFNEILEVAKILGGKRLDKVRSLLISLKDKGALEYSYDPGDSFDNFFIVENCIEASLQSIASVDTRQMDAEPETSPRNRCTLCGLREILRISNNCWNNLVEAGVVEENERLCALCMVKRISMRWEDTVDPFIEATGIPPETSKEIKLAEYPSTSDAATAWFRATFLSTVIAGIKRCEKYSAEVKKLLSKISELFSKYQDDLKKILRLSRVYLREERWNDILDRVCNKYRRRNSLFENLVQELEDCLRKGMLNGKEYMNTFFLAFLPSELLILEEALTLIERERLSRRSRYSDEELKRLAESIVRFHQELESDVFNRLEEMFRSNEGKAEFAKCVEEVLKSHIKRVLNITFDPTVDFFGESIFLPLATRPSQRFVLMRGDGDSIGEWLRGEIFPPSALFYSGTSLIRAISQGDDFIKLLKGKRPLAPVLFHTMSFALTVNAFLVFPKIIEAFGGFVIYSGGDDTLALMPPESWMFAYMFIRLYFSREASLEKFEFERSSKEAKRPKRWLIEIYVPGMGYRATMSLGVVLADIKAHLRYVAQQSLEIEDMRSKGISRPGERRKLKDGLSVALVSRGAVLRSANAIPNVLIQTTLREKSDDEFIIPIRHFADLSDIKAIKTLDNFSRNQQPTPEGAEELFKKLRSTPEMIINAIGRPESPEFIGVSISKKDSTTIVAPILLAYQIARGVIAQKAPRRVITTLMELTQECALAEKEYLRVPIKMLIKREMRRKDVKEEAREFLERTVEEILKLEKLRIVARIPAGGTKKSEVYLPYELSKLADILHECFSNCTLRWK